MTFYLNMSIYEQYSDASLDDLDKRLETLLKSIEVPDVEKVENHHREQFNCEYLESVLILNVFLIFKFNLIV